MTSEKLQDAIGEVKDCYIREADTRIQKRKRTWVKYFVAAACLCAVVGGILWAKRPTTPDGPIVVTVLQKINIPERLPGGLGEEVLICRDSSELCAGNPWSEDMKLDILPVYSNKNFDPSGAGVPIGLDETEMTARLENAAKALGLTLSQTEIEKVSGAEDGNDWLYSITASTENWRLTAEADGHIRYELFDDYKLPEQYKFTPYGSTAKEMEEAIEYLAEEFSSFTGYEKSETIVLRDYAFDGDLYQSGNVYDSASDNKQDILNYNFNYTEFVPSLEGGLCTIDKYDGLSTAELIGEYPVISVKKATEKLLSGLYQVSSTMPHPEKKNIAKVELVYNTGCLQEALMPYYRFYVELPETDDITMAAGLKRYGAYYVPAIADEYIANPLKRHTKQSAEINEKKQPAQTDITYQTIINAINGQISGKYSDGYITDDIEAKVDLTSIREEYVELGYLLDDIDNDDVYDLIVGVNPTEKFSDWAGSIYKIYTSIDGEVVQAAGGDYRHCYYLCEDGTIAQESFDDGFSNGYMFYSLKNGKLELIETVVRQEKETAEGNKTELWLYSDSLTYEYHDDIERYEAITESKAKEIMAKYKYTYPSFNAFDGIILK